MLYILAGLVAIIGGIACYVLWLLFWRGTRVDDIPLILSFLLKFSRVSATLASPEEDKWIEFRLYEKDGKRGIRVRVPCFALDDAQLRKLTAALGRGKRVHSFDHRRILYADFGASVNSVHRFSRTVLLDAFGFPETQRYKYRPGGSMIPGQEQTGEK